MAKGPAPKGEYVGKSSVFSTRITPDLRKRLKQAAKRSGRSVSQEVENRLRRSFVEDNDIAERFGDRKTYSLMRMMADAIHFEGVNTTWLENPVEFAKAASAAMRILELVSPESTWPADAHPIRHYEVQGHNIGRRIWSAVKRADTSLPVTAGTRDDHKNRLLRDGLGEDLVESAIVSSKQKGDDE